MSDDLILSGRRLQAAVRAAETPILGELARRNLVAQLRLDEVFDLDLSEWNPEPASLPLHQRPAEPSDHD